MGGWFTKEYPAQDWFRGESSTSGQGRWYMFFVVPRTWIHGKYLRWRWAAYPGYSGFTTHVEVWDGSYDRGSMVDFPNGAVPVTKGNGMLQELASKGGTFVAQIDDVQIDTSGGNQQDVTIIIWSNDAWTAQYGLFEIDWIEVNDSAGGADNLYFETFDPASYISEAGGSNGYGYISGGNVPEWTSDLSCAFSIRNSGDLKGIFTIRQWQEELLAGFTSKQWQEDLLAEVISRQSASSDFPAQFAVQRTATPLELLGVFSTGGSGNVHAKVRVEKYYNLEGTGGIAFYWWGADNPPEAMNQLILETATGFWYTDFYDGVAAWRLVEIPWGSFTWVAAQQRYLEPHRHGFEEPNQQQIGGFIWTVHTHGERRLDYIYAYPRVPNSELLGYFAIQRTATPVELLAEFITRRDASQELLGKFTVAQTGTPQDLLAGLYHLTVIPALANFNAGFRVAQETMDLPAVLRVNIQKLNLPAKFSVRLTEIEDFEDAILVDHYQHFSGNGFRNALFPHTGTYSWRTRAGQNDIFDISNGETLTYAKVELWARYGNGTRKIELLDSGFSTLAQTTWTTSTPYHQKSVEYTGAVKYLRITCPAGGNSGLWTDDVEIEWMT